VGEWRSLGAAKNAKFAKASNLRKHHCSTSTLDFDSKNPTNRQNLFTVVAQCAAKKEPGNPDKDFGVSSEVHWAMGETYATAYDGDLI
jgi:hypothetical protein